MADLMTNVTTYGALELKYGGFMVPAKKVKLAGVDITKLDFIHVSNIQIQLSLDKACSATLTIEGAYNLMTRSFNPAIMKSLQLGTLISIELGYGSSTTMVFYGYISSLAKTFNDAPSIEVTALDLIRLLMDSSRVNYIYRDKSYSDILQEILKKFALAYQKTNITPTVEKIPEIVQKSSDYKFIKKKLCRAANREFFALAGVVYFREPDKNKTPLMTLEWGKSLMSFSLNTSFINEELKLFGQDPKKKQHIEASLKVKSDSKMFPITFSPIPKEFQDASVQDKGSADKWLKHKAHDELKNSRSGNGSCIGLPEIVPGRYLKLSNLDSSIPDSVYVKSVTHSFGESGYTTSFEIGGW